MNKDHALPFPAGRPDLYRPLVDEPIFDPAKHLALDLPKETFKLGQLGYQEGELEGFASDFAYSSAFRILSDEGIDSARDVLGCVVNAAGNRRHGMSPKSGACNL